jgi:colicin import membrane protein
MLSDQVPKGNDKKSENKRAQSSSSNKAVKNTTKEADANPSDFFRASIVKSALLHGLLLLALLVSFNFSSKPLEFASQAQASAQPVQEIVQATFVDSNVIEQNKREKAQAQAAARKRQQDAIREKEKERDRLRKAENARKKREQEAQKEQERVEAEQERLNALERERQKEQEIAEQRAQQEAMQEQLAQEMAEQLEREQQAMQAAQNRKVMTELEKYQSLITQTIMRNLNSDGGFKGKKCKLNVKLASNGLVLEVKALEGNDALCRAAQTAVLRPSTLPVSSDPLVFEKMKNLNIIVEL